MYGVIYGSKFIFFAHRYPAVPVPFIEKNILSLLNEYPLKPCILPIVHSNSYYKQSYVITESWNFLWPEECCLFLNYSFSFESIRNSWVLDRGVYYVWGMFSFKCENYKETFHISPVNL